MNYGQFKSYQHQFVRGLRAVLSEGGDNTQVFEAAFPAYADANPLIRFLFWRRLWITINFLRSYGPYEAVLDFGCGSGIILPLLAEFANRVVGVDIDLGPYRALSTHLSLLSELEVYEATEQPLSRFSDNTFDAITSLDVLEHVDNLRDVLAEFCRITKPGSMVVVSGPTENLFYKIGRIVAGKVYTGDYHVTNIYDIQAVMNTFMEVKTIATLYYPFPLFKIIVGRIAR